MAIVGKGRLIHGIYHSKMSNSRDKRTQSIGEIFKCCHLAEKEIISRSSNDFFYTLSLKIKWKKEGKNVWHNSKYSVLPYASSSLILTIASHFVWENILYRHNYRKWERGNRYAKTRNVQIDDFTMRRGGLILTTSVINYQFYVSIS